MAAFSLWVIGSAIKQAADDYRPLLGKVRAIERDARRIENEIADLKIEISRVGGGVSEEQGILAQDRVEILTNQRNLLLAGIPADWSDANGRLSSLLKTRNDTQRNYRRKVDDAYEPLVETISPLVTVKNYYHLKKN